MNHEPAALRDAAIAAAAIAARFLLEQEGTQAADRWGVKGSHDFVTEVDREAERKIAASLTAAVPGSVVVGEELNPELKASSRLTWIVDPLDGTMNYLHRFPYYSVSIAAMLEGELLAGVVHHPRMDIVYAAARGAGATQNGAPIRVSVISDLQQALIGTGFPFKALDRLEEYQRQFGDVTRGAGGLRRVGSAALDLCDVAAGRYDGFWELLLAPWDVAAGTLIVREAGGIVTGLEGEADVLRHGPIVAGNATIHPWLIETLKST